MGLPGRGVRGDGVKKLSVSQESQNDAKSQGAKGTRGGTSPQTCRKNKGL